MSTHHLDGDLDRWPEDPYELLGVHFGVLPRDLRRAYTHLIRTYKPEQFPEHFRRIREAYEAILQYVEIFQFSAADPDTEPEELPEPVDAEPEADDDFSAPESPPPPDGLEDQSSLPRFEEAEEEGTDLPPWRPPSQEDDFHDLWQRACAGEEAAAYGRLLELQHRPTDAEGVYLRLYWLLALMPELDVGRSPCEWLVQGLEANGLIGPLRELYRREIEAAPAEAVTERCTRLLDSQSGTGQILDLVEWRWQAAGRLGRWDVIDRDLQSLRQPVLNEDEEAWVRLLLSAVDQLTWAPDKAAHALVQRCCQEVEQFQHLSARLGSELDRLDFLREIAGGWHFLKTLRSAGVPKALLRLIPASWTRPFEEVRPALLSFLDWVAQYPQAALQSFDLVKKRASGVLAQFGQLLDQFRDNLDSPPDPDIDEAITGQALDFLDALKRFDYQAIRGQVLAFCLREAITPEVLAEIVEDRSAYQLSADQHLSEALTDDWPLRYVVLAYQLFWA